MQERRDDGLAGEGPRGAAAAAAGTALRPSAARAGLRAESGCARPAALVVHTYRHMLEAPAATDAERVCVELARLIAGRQGGQTRASPEIVCSPSARALPKEHTIHTVDALSACAFVCVCVTIAILAQALVDCSNSQPLAGVREREAVATQQCRLATPRGVWEAEVQKAPALFGL